MAYILFGKVYGDNPKPTTEVKIIKASDEPNEYWTDEQIEQFSQSSNNTNCGSVG